MITSVSFRSFKAIHAADIALERLTVLVGPNASGKTSVLEGLEHLATLLLNHPRQLFQGRWECKLLRTRRMTEAMVLMANLESGDGKGQLRFSAESELGGNHPENWKLSWEATWNEFRFNTHLPPPPPFGTQEDTATRETQTTATEQLRSALSGVLLRLDPRRLAEPTESSQETPQLEADGRHLAEVLQYMALQAPAEFESLQESVRAVIPGVQRLRFDRALIEESEGRSTRWGYQLVVDMKCAPDIPAYAVSDGTLLVIGLLTVLMSPTRPQLILMDDIERALHPKASGELIAQLRRILDAYPDLQIVATSHSPYLIDHLRPEEVRLSTLDENGAAMFAPLTSHPEFERWKDQMLPGEFWSTVGEDWVKGQAKRKDG